MASQITSLTIVYLTVYSAQIKWNIKSPSHWSLCGEFTGDRWIPRTNGQWREKYIHLMTPSCERFYHGNSNSTVNSFCCNLITGQEIDSNWCAYFTTAQLLRRAQFCCDHSNRICSKGNSILFNLNRVKIVIDIGPWPIWPIFCRRCFNVYFRDIFFILF